VAADRLTPQAANAFLKTLEEPPPGSILILLSTDPQRLLETLLSRCLRLNFGGSSRGVSESTPPCWLEAFAQAMAAGKQGTLDRYRLLSVLLAELARLRETVEKDLAARSNTQRYEEIDPRLRERWEDELQAAVESNYREQRAKAMALLQGWLHDVWVVSAQLPQALIQLPGLADLTQAVGTRLSPQVCRANLQVLDSVFKLLNTNVQETLVLEVALLKLRL
jgi:DNA polymerase-3 subunit delta'